MQWIIILFQGFLALIINTIAVTVIIMYVVIIDIFIITSIIYHENGNVVVINVEVVTLCFLPLISMVQQMLLLMAEPYWIHWLLGDYPDKDHYCGLLVNPLLLAWRSCWTNIRTTGNFRRRYVHAMLP